MNILLKNLYAVYRAVVPSTLRRHISGARALLLGSSIDRDRHDFMRRAFSALKFNGIVGDYAEFGCYRGLTFSSAYHESRAKNYNCRLWAFDSFCGLPPPLVAEDDHPHWIEGTMRTSVEQFKEICRLRGIPESEYQIVPGFYEFTLKSRELAAKLPDSISLAYIDCVLYSSAKTVLDFLSTRITHGSIIAFDDYFCYSPRTIAGERLACAEFLKANPRFHFSPHCQFDWHGMAFIVEDKTYWKTVDCTVLP